MNSPFNESTLVISGIKAPSEMTCDSHTIS